MSSTTFEASTMAMTSDHAAGCEGDGLQSSDTSLFIPMVKDASLLEQDLGALRSSADNLESRPTHPTLGRSTSQPDPGFRSRVPDSAIIALKLQKLLTDKLTPGGHSKQMWWTKRSRTPNNPPPRTESISAHAVLKLLPMRTKSESASTSLVSMKTHEKRKPMKSSLKSKSKSAAATPPTDNTTNTDRCDETQPLRRVKTVDFAGTMSRKLLSLPLESRSIESRTEAPRRKTRECEQVQSGSVDMKLAGCTSGPVCPPYTFKSKLADCAVTRTDVHVVAVAPCQTSDAAEGDDDTATPTMQIVESSESSYEVIWDDVPAEDNVKSSRRSSSAGQALQAIGANAARGLERVNSKLAEWNWGRSQHEAFTPRVVVFPDDDSHKLRNAHAVPTTVPPNSQSTSTGPSLHPSRAVSAEIPTESEDQEDQGTASEASDKIEEFGAEDSNATLTVPDPDATTATLVGSGRKTMQSLPIRKLSNIDDSKMKFRGHRDSVTLARSRIHHSRSVPSELLKHRDSVSMAKKRLHVENHATSDARAISHPKCTLLGERAASDDCVLLSPDAVKQHAARALKSSSSASMLRPQDEGPKRHIRIVE